MERLYLKTVSRDLLENKTNQFEAISFFNFENGTQKINLKKSGKDTVLTQGTTWIRVHIKNGTSYDFITGSLTAFNIDGTLIVMCNDDAEFIDALYISKLVKDFEINTEGIDSSTQEETLVNFYRNMKKETSKISNQMEKLYQVSNQMSSSRLNIQDSYDYGKQQLERMNMLNILIKQVASENKDEILALI